MVFLQDSWALMPPTFRWCGDLVPSGTAPAISSYSARAMMCPAPQMCTMTLNTMAHQAVTTSEKALLTLNTSLVSETACTPSYRSTALNYCHIFHSNSFCFSAQTPLLLQKKDLVLEQLYWILPQRFHLAQVTCPKCCQCLSARSHPTPASSCVTRSLLVSQTRNAWNFCRHSVKYMFLCVIHGINHSFCAGLHVLV